MEALPSNADMLLLVSAYGRVGAPALKLIPAFNPKYQLLFCCP